MNLTDNDKQRIEPTEQEQKDGWRYTIDFLRAISDEITSKGGKVDLEDIDEILDIVQFKQLEAERSEVRNKVIEECVEKVRYSYNLSLGATDTVVELLNSLKTK